MLANGRVEIIRMLRLENQDVQADNEQLKREIVLLKREVRNLTERNNYLDGKPNHTEYLIGKLEKLTHDLTQTNDVLSQLKKLANKGIRHATIELKREPMDKLERVKLEIYTEILGVMK